MAIFDLLEFKIEIAELRRILQKRSIEKTKQYFEKQTVFCKVKLNMLRVFCLGVININENY